MSYPVHELLIGPNNLCTGEKENYDIMVCTNPFLNLYLLRALISANTNRILVVCDIWYDLTAMFTPLTIH